MLRCSEIGVSIGSVVEPLSASAKGMTSNGRA